MWWWLVLAGCRTPDPDPATPPELPPLQEAPCLAAGETAAYEEVALPLADPRGEVEVGDIDGDGADELVWLQGGSVHTSDGLSWVSPATDHDVGDLDGDGIAEIAIGRELSGGHGEFECDNPPVRFDPAYVFDHEGTRLTTWSQWVDGIFCIYTEAVDVEIDARGRLVINEGYDSWWMVEGLDGGFLDEEALFRAPRVGIATSGDLYGDGTVEVAVRQEGVLRIYPEEWGGPDPDAVDDLPVYARALAAVVLDGDDVDELIAERSIVDPGTGAEIGTIPGDVVLDDLTGDGVPELGEIRVFEATDGDTYEIRIYEGPFEGFVGDAEPWLQIDVAPREEGDGAVEQITTADLDGNGVHELLVGRGATWPAIWTVVPICP